MSFAFWKCKHPAGMLVVQRDQEVVPVDADFEHVVYHLRCLQCGEEVKVRYARHVGGVDAVFQRKYREWEAKRNGI